MIYARHKRPKRVPQTPPPDPTKAENDALRAENQGLRAKLAELEALLSVATAPSVDVATPAPRRAAK